MANGPSPSRRVHGGIESERAIEQVPRQWVINRTTAVTLGMTIPPDVYALADEVIDQKTAWRTAGLDQCGALANTPAFSINAVPGTNALVRGIETLR